MNLSPFPSTILSLLRDNPFLPCDADGPESESLQNKAYAPRILVIDDEVTIADSLTEILADQGYHATAIYDAWQAIDLVRTCCPDFVIADVIMPKLNGVDMAMAIRTACPKAKIVLFSGQAGTADLLANARAKGHDFVLLPKPVHPDKLLQTLEKLKRS